MIMCSVPYIKPCRYNLLTFNRLKIYTDIFIHSNLSTGGISLWYWITEQGSKKMLVKQHFVLHSALKAAPSLSVASVPCSCFFCVSFLASHLKVPHFKVPHLEVLHPMVPHPEVPHLEVPHLEVPHLEVPHLKLPHLEVPHLEVPHL